VESDRLYAAWLLSATTGLRRGELLGLRWQDVDLEAETASISQTLLAVGFKVSVGQPKTGRGYRQVALFPAAVDALRQHRTRMETEYAGRGKTLTNDAFIFTRDDGAPVHPDRFSELFDLHIRAAGLPRIRLHDLRHTHATLGLAAGIHPKIMSERLGHSSISITLDTYSHAIPGMQREAAERMSELLFEQPLVAPKTPLVTETGVDQLAEEPV
jgi:integrase